MHCSFDRLKRIWTATALAVLPFGLWPDKALQKVGCFLVGGPALSAYAYSHRAERDVDNHSECVGKCTTSKQHRSARWPVSACLFPHNPVRAGYPITRDFSLLPVYLLEPPFHFPFPLLSPPNVFPNRTPDRLIANPSSPFPFISASTTRTKMLRQFTALARPAASLRLVSARTFATSAVRMAEGDTGAPPKTGSAYVLPTAQERDIESGCDRR